MSSIANALTYFVFALICIAGMLLFTGSLWAHVTFDNLIKLEYQLYSDEWKKSGQPRGWFWQPPKQTYSSYRENFRGYYTGNWLRLAWLFWTPQWIRGDATAGKLLRRFRILMAIWNLGILLPLLAFVMAIALHPS